MNTETQTSISTRSGEVDFEEPAPSTWSPTFFAQDQFRWDELLQDVPDEQFNAADLDRTGRQPISTPCKCFRSALQTIKRLDECQNNFDTTSIDSTLIAAQEAVQTCRRFCDCDASCYRSNTLLHVTILQLLNTLYASIGSWLVSTAERSHVKQDVQVSIGTFKSKASLHSTVGRAILSSEISEAMSCTVSLSRLLRVRSMESSTEELKCLEDVLSALAASLYQKANELFQSNCLPEPNISHIATNKRLR